MRYLLLTIVFYFFQCSIVELQKLHASIFSLQVILLMQDHKDCKFLKVTSTTKLFFAIK